MFMHQGPIALLCPRLDVDVVKNVAFAAKPNIDCFNANNIIP